MTTREVDIGFFEVNVYPAQREIDESGYSKSPLSRSPRIIGLSVYPEVKKRPGITYALFRIAWLFEELTTKASLAGVVRAA